jgi:hypothetical protein
VALSEEENLGGGKRGAASGEVYFSSERSLYLSLHCVHLSSAEDSESLRDSLPLKHHGHEQCPKVRR